MNIIDKFNEFCKLSVEEALQKIEDLIEDYPRGFVGSNISIKDLETIQTDLLHAREELYYYDLDIEDKFKIVANSLRVIEKL